MSGTILVKSPVISQWWNITVTAPSVTNIPSGFYDGTETITANGWGILPSWWSVVNVAEWSVRLQWWWWSLWWIKTYASAVYDNTTTILWFTILFQSWPSYSVIVGEFEKATWVNIMKSNQWWMANYSSLDSIYINSWVITVNYVISWPADRNVKYTIATNTWSLPAIWFDTTWTLLTDSVPYIWYTAKHYISFDSSAWWYWINCFELS